MLFISDIKIITHKKEDTLSKNNYKKMISLSFCEKFQPGSISS